jgi:preprotein translocase subunit SecD
MKSWQRNINGIFFALALVGLCAGCATDDKKPVQKKTPEQKEAERKDKKEKAIIMFHVEATPDPSRTTTVPVFRANPVLLTINSDPFAGNGEIDEISIVDLDGGGWGIRVKFDAHGKLVLQNITSRNMGRHLAVYVAFPEIRWLAAPRIARRIADGVFIFTPDCTREEADRIVKGVMNVTKEARKGFLE